MLITTRKKAYQKTANATTAVTTTLKASLSCVLLKFAAALVLEEEDDFEPLFFTVSNPSAAQVFNVPFEAPPCGGDDDDDDDDEEEEDGAACGGPGNGALACPVVFVTVKVKPSRAVESKVSSLSRA